MSVEVDVKLDGKTLSSFLLYHNYRKISGVVGVLLSLAALAFFVINYNHLATNQKIVLILLALLFTVIQPIILANKGRKQAKKEEMQKSVHYTLGESGIELKQDELKDFWKWSDVRKVCYRKQVVYIYTSQLHAFVIPASQCGEDFDKVVKVIKENCK